MQWCSRQMSAQPPSTFSTKCICQSAGRVQRHAHQVAEQPLQS
jgi:hypothetical protein